MGRGNAGKDCRRWRGGAGLADVAVVVLAVVIGVWCWRCWRSSAGAPAVAAITACGGGVSVGSENGQCCVFRAGSMLFPEQIFVSQRSLHNAPIFRLLLKVAVNGTHQCDFPNFCGQRCPTQQLQHVLGEPLSISVAVVAAVLALVWWRWLPWSTLCHDCSECRSPIKTYVHPPVCCFCDTREIIVGPKPA